jgi:hypothetical protein
MSLERLPELTIDQLRFLLSEHARIVGELAQWERKYAEELKETERVIPIRERELRGLIARIQQEAESKKKSIMQEAANIRLQLSAAELNIEPFRDKGIFGFIRSTTYQSVPYTSDAKATVALIETKLRPKIRELEAGIRDVERGAEKDIRDATWAVERIKSNAQWILEREFSHPDIEIKIKRETIRFLITNEAQPMSL